MNVSDMMSSPVHVMGQDEPISHARNLMLKHKINTLVVVENEEIVGIVTKSDLGKKLAQAEPMWRRRPIDKIPVKMVMTPEPVTIYPEATLPQAVNLLLENDINDLPVVKSGRLQGILTRTDVVECIAKQTLDIKISQIMSHDPIFVHRHHTINHVIDEMEVNKVSKIIVTNDSGETVGMITTRELALSMLKDNEGKLPSKSIKMARRPTSGGEKIYRYIKDVPLVAEDIMSDIDCILNVDDTVTEAARIMIEKKYTGLPIAKGKEVVGIVTRTDILRVSKNEDCQA